MCKVVLNEKLNGVEVYFETKPAQEIINSLKENKFRWNRSKSCWYAKQNENTLALANTYGKIEQVSTGETAIKAIKKSDNIDLFELTNIKNIVKNQNVGKYDTKEIAKEVRTQLKKIFPFVKFSITISRFSGGSEIYATVKNSIFEKDSIYLESVIKYADALVNVYNYCDSDPYADYYNTNFYFFGAKIDYDYEVVENNKFNLEKITTLFDEKKAIADKEEEERKEKEYQAYLKEQEKKEAEYKKDEEERKIKETEIINNVKVVELAEENQYMITNVVLPSLNKNNTIEEVKEEINNKMYYQDCKVTRELHFNNETAFNDFSNMLLNDFDFLKNAGGSYTDDIRINSMEDYRQMSEQERKTVKFNLYVIAVYLNNELMFIIDPQGYSYARYVGIMDTNTKVLKDTNDLEYNQVLSNEEIEYNTNKANDIINVVSNVIKDKDLNKIYSNAKDWYDTRNNIIEAIKSNNKHLDKTIIQQVKESNCKEYIKYKDMLYRCINEVNNVSDQAKLLNNGYITIVKTSMIAGCSINYLKLENINILNDDRIQLCGHVDGKRGTYGITISNKDDVLVYQGYKEIDKTVLYEIDSNSIITKYGSYDKESLDAVIEYCNKKYNEYPVLNTYRTLI